MYTHILRCCGRTYLLPNLAYFKPVKLDAKEVFFLMYPHLRELSISPPVNANPSIFLNSLQSLSPSLVDLNLQNVVLDNRCLSALCLLTRLEKVIVLGATSGAASVTLDFLLEMSARHTLRHLELSGSALKIVPPSNPPVDFDPITFSALEHVDIDCDLAIAAVTVLCHITFPVLEVFKIGLQNVLGPRRLWLEEHFSTPSATLQPSILRNWESALRRRADPRKSPMSSSHGLITHPLSWHG